MRTFLRSSLVAGDMVDLSDMLRIRLGMNEFKDEEKNSTKRDCGFHAQDSRFGDTSHFIDVWWLTAPVLA